MEFQERVIINLLNTKIANLYNEKIWKYKLGVCRYEKEYRKQNKDDRIDNMLKICRSLQKSKFYVEQNLDSSMYIIANLDKFHEWQKNIFDNIIFNIIFNIPYIRDRERFEITCNTINIRFIENECFKQYPSFTIYDKIKNKVLRGFNFVDIIYEFSKNKFLLKDDNDIDIIKNYDCNSRILIITARKIEIVENMNANITYFIHYGLKYNTLLYLKDNYLQKTITDFFSN